LITLSCDMDFTNFPYDVQTCGFKVGTFLEDAKAVTLGFWENVDPITLAKNTQDANQQPNGGTDEWEVVDVRAVVQEEGTLHGATQDESSVELVLELRRVADYYSVFVILPAVMFVTIGWGSFFISRTQAPARVAMSIIGFLANTNFIASQLGQLPRLGTEVWLLKFLLLSTIFSFYSVIEYVICNYLFRIEARIEGGCKRAQELRSPKKEQELRLAKKKQELRSSKKKQAQLKKSRTSLEMAQVPRTTTTGTPTDQDPPDSELCEQTNGADDLNFEDLEEPVITVTKKELKRSGFNYKVDTWLLKTNGEMRIKDQHVDIFSRYAYPIAYTTACLVLWYKRVY
jgi:hypothetical protein